MPTEGDLTIWYDDSGNPLSLMLFTPEALAASLEFELKVMFVLSPRVGLSWETSARVDLPDLPIIIHSSQEPAEIIGGPRVNIVKMLFEGVLEKINGCWYISPFTDFPNEADSFAVPASADIFCTNPNIPVGDHQWIKALDRYRPSSFTRRERKYRRQFNPN